MMREGEDLSYHIVLKGSFQEAEFEESRVVWRIYCYSQHSFVVNQVLDSGQADAGSINPQDSR